MDFKTPNQDRKSPELPKLNRGKILRSVTDELSDDDLCELGLSGIEEIITPKTNEPLQKKMKNIETIKNDKNNSYQMIDDELKTVKDQMRNNNQYDDSFIDDHMSETIEMTDESDQVIPSTSSNNELNSEQSDYSDLMYLEAYGVLRTINTIKNRKKKHRTPRIFDTEYIEDDLTSNLSQGRKTRLKISYRFNK